MWQAFKNAFKIPELRDRIIFTFLALIVFRMGIYIPVPGLNLEAWGEIFRRIAETAGVAGILSFYDVFTGGALSRFSVFTMSVTPYITASIILQLLASVMPSLKEMLREGEEGRKKFAKYTRRLTLLIGGFQAFFVSFSLARSNPDMVAPGVNVLQFTVLSTMSMLAGTMFLLWLGERITEKGIGNGISILIFAGIVARYPSYIRQAYLGGLNLLEWIFLIAVALITIFGIILVQQAERRITIQYARRVTGRRVYGGASTYLPIKVNQGGVIPIIFASAIVSIPSAIASITNNETLKNLFRAGGFLYLLIYGLLVFFFTYFYSVVIFDPREISENIRKYGGYIPGLRPGRSTEQYLHRVLNRVTFIGAVFLVVIALLPYLVQGAIKVNVWIGGTSALIAVGVALDIIQQMETHMVMRHYEGFIKKGKIRGRR
ncbi:preprotein translocase subunit SecY [Thermotoga maritima MSB8]|uniref:Protein translocase subunit SecY n=1 Tax=Thermotoga maritima (strain ATCC 43589 / DSM 3109 / JCM 10099 / NBRC 100826 / MSB8) TaxID=243274 RepID=SECY_THEMA|nr:preprotein translocase subunit SecY [Thermotoga maritima]Q9X1I9.1 RecName: Full=Protein translocase subunit SecY [Thermotoga maritima MSB8]3DIN_C Chain C, Preprotein translocase subunit SecY [Thermotoga maritima MSB8]3DIN_F Chain F, Preprotein translocase subunit SecY [Thermotoga maritima MSB8]AAD36546.1 preprotein translocase SecY subunit [Thermotoga maritima MSB8]AGL50412.1 Preprotein translocase secY subunit [Thermotoga maritima MSB8]AHD18625.1 preprotein translocase subunit SecY [Therm